MQGRLTEPRGRGIQFFPFENWREEFTQGKKLGLDEIEFIFDYDRYQENPLWQGRGEMVGSAVSESGVQVRSVCFDYFMRRAFYKKEGAKPLFEMAKQVKSGDPDNLEGYAARIYWDAVFKNFSRRDNTIHNAALDYGYAIMRGALARAIVFAICYRLTFNFYLLIFNFKQYYVFHMVCMWEHIYRSHSCNHIILAENLKVTCL